MKYQYDIITETPKKFSEQEFFHIKFTNLDLLKQEIKYSFFEDCIFEKCNFTLTDLHDTELRNVQFIKCKLQGINFSVIKNTITQIAFQDCLIDNSSFSHIKLPNAYFDKSTIRNTQFISADLSKTSFVNCNLKNTIFQNCIMHHTDFSNATNFYIDPQQNQFKQTKFTHPEVLLLLDALDIIIE